MSVRQLPFDLRSTPALGREDFFVAECNELALHWVEIWPQGWQPFPALILHGPRGSGKSHLADVWRTRADALKWSAFDVMAATTDDILGLKQNIVLDRIDLLIGDVPSEEKLFHLYNYCGQNGLYLLGLSWIAPESMQFSINDLGSRLRAAPHAAIFPPDDVVLFKVLARRFHDQGYVVMDGAIQFALTRMERSWESMDCLIEKAIRKATAEKKQITIPLLRDLMMEQ